MQEQNFKNHVRYIPQYHFLLSSIILALNVLTVINLISALKTDSGIMEAAMFLLIAITLSISFLMIRGFPLKAQDRAIRAEENLRYFSLTGKLLDNRLTMSQIIALRFAADEELITLADRALKENLSKKDIKKAIQHWRPDHNRL